MKFSFTLDTKNPPELHPERQANRDLLSSLKTEEMSAAGIGLLMVLAIYTPPEDFKRLVEYGTSGFKQGITNEFLKKMN